VGGFFSSMSVIGAKEFILQQHAAIKKEILRNINEV
jgi:hypothetical protein